MQTAREKFKIKMLYCLVGIYVNEKWRTSATMKTKLNFTWNLRNCVTILIKSLFSCQKCFSKSRSKADYTLNMKTSLTQQESQHLQHFLHGLAFKNGTKRLNLCQQNKSNTFQTDFCFQITKQWKVLVQSQMQPSS